MKIQNISINNINKTKIDPQFSKTTTNHSNYQITSLTNLYYPIAFKAKEKKIFLQQKKLQNEKHWNLPQLPKEKICLNFYKCFILCLYLPELKQSM